MPLLAQWGLSKLHPVCRLRQNGECCSEHASSWGCGSERTYGDQAAAAAAFGSRGLGSLGAAGRTQSETLNSLEQARLANIQSAFGTRAGADQSVMNANVAREQQLFDAERARLCRSKLPHRNQSTQGLKGLQISVVGFCLV